ncbi:GDSL-type esterase/lipase family protein [Myxacorys almedinensis]|uniref:Lipase n=1 Tax=Myxacorys almedinensis A TaxID=2690445 RepID=A0A8J8CI06_9CYAN|nr:GDSL-type esterase/lipase family protein [Myxacorys almedinensis]NDJ17253.1 lipase [Myxacorys almedinensis A]
MRVCFLGDSFVNGTGDPEYLGWVGRLCGSARQTRPDLTSYNLGIRRETSRQLRQRWRQEVALRLPAEVEGRLVFSFGANDTTVENGRQRLATVDSLDHLRAILTEAKAGFPVLMIGAPAIADPEHTARIETLSHKMAIVCHSLSVPYLDTVSTLKRSEVWMQEVAAGDGAHPGAAGYAAFAELVENWAAWQAWVCQKAPTD